MGSLPIIYSDANFGGNSQTLYSPGYYVPANLTIGAGTLSSIYLPPGWTATLYDQDADPGPETGDLITQSLSYVGDQWNDQTYYIRLTQQAAQQAPAGPFDWAKFDLQIDHNIQAPPAATPPASGSVPLWDSDSPYAYLGTGNYVPNGPVEPEGLNSGLFGGGGGGGDNPLMDMLMMGVFNK